MTDYAIEAFNLGKRFVLGEALNASGTLRDVLSGALSRNAASRSHSFWKA